MHSTSAAVVLPRRGCTLLCKCMCKIHDIFYPREQKTCAPNARILSASFKNVCRLISRAVLIADAQANVRHYELKQNFYRYLLTTRSRRKCECKSFACFGELNAAVYYELNFQLLILLFLYYNCCAKIFEISLLFDWR